MAVKGKRLPPDCGRDLGKEFLYNPYQVELLDKRRQRICPSCQTIAPVDGFGVFVCPSCKFTTQSQLEARKAFHRLSLVAGRRSGKTKTGAHAAREECVVPDGLGWVCGPTVPIMRDSTVPAFCGLIPPDWVDDYDTQAHNLTLTNGHRIAFRSLHDLTRGVGIGPSWLWIDECQKVRERAWDILRPALTDHLGNAIFTFTPNGFDWCWRRLYRPAFEDRYRLSGFWAARFGTVDNPWIQKYAMSEVEEARASMDPWLFRQEYEADFVSFSGNVYDWEQIEQLVLRGDDIKSFIPEWPHIDPSRQGIVGLGGGVTHPFAGLLVVPTDRGLVVCSDYLKEHRSITHHHDNLVSAFAAKSLIPACPLPLRFAADEDKKYIFTEFGQSGAGVVPTPHYLMTGVQRTQSWIYSKRLFFAGAETERTLDQMREYRWNDLMTEDGQRTDDERDLLINEELPKALHAALLSYPELPPAPKPLNARDASLPPRVLDEIEEFRAHQEQQDRGEDDDWDRPAIAPTSPNWPLGDFYGQHGSD